MLDSEGHRRLVGNDIAVIFFLDFDDTETSDNGPFDPCQVSLLGTVPQLFIVIQPAQKGTLFRYEKK